MKHPRSSGVLMHPTSLPGRFGVGDIGPRAHEFVEFLARTGQRWWQMLPLGPTGAGNSPYQSHSSFAGNPLLISPEAMVESGWLEEGDLPEPVPATDRVDYEAAFRAKDDLLARAFARFSAADADFHRFVIREKEWLQDYALFMAIKEARGGSAWFQWEPELIGRDPEALETFARESAEALRFHEFVQYVFYEQWNALRAACARRGVKLIGDVPIFVAHDSADVWAHPELFFLGGDGKPTFVAGVPPDYFSETGQLWGNPLYNWEAHAAEGYAWWIARIGALLKQVDLIRIDHFRGFEAFWEIPGGAETAVNGRWVPGPGAALFDVLKEHYPDLPFIAEDLGVITPPVEALRDQFDLPGMRVLQFGFADDPEAAKHLPYRHVVDCVAYTGTHDNDTSYGWISNPHVETTQSIEQIERERLFALRFVGTDGREFGWDLIRQAWGSVAAMAIAPMQDVLGLGDQARMNVPGRAEGNWEWRMLPDRPAAHEIDRLASFTSLYGRWNGEAPDKRDQHREDADRDLPPELTPESTAADAEREPT